MQSCVGAVTVLAIIPKHLDKSPSVSCSIQSYLLTELITKWQNLSMIFQIFNTSNNSKPNDQYLCYHFMSIDEGNNAWIKFKSKHHNFLRDFIFSCLKHCLLGVDTLILRNLNKDYYFFIQQEYFEHPISAR